MTDQTRPFSEDELLAFTQGTASPDLAERIGMARAGDPELAAELALMAGLKPALAGSAEGGNAPGEFGWRRLEAAIGRGTQAAPAPATHQADRRLNLWRAAAVVCGLAALGQGAYLVTVPGGGAPGYQTATDGVVEHVLALRFQPDATEAEIRGLLQATGARLVDGPGASGLYRIAFQSEEALIEARPRLDAAEIIDLVLDE